LATGTLGAVQTTDPGDVLLFDDRGRMELNTFGSIAALCGDRAGLRGAIRDGASRAVDDVRVRNPHRARVR
jgi:regulator of RNase E activity RraA